MKETVKTGNKGLGLTISEEFDIYKFAEEGLVNNSDDLAKIAQYVSASMNKEYFGHWAVFIVKSLETPWKVGCKAAKNKYVEFSLLGHSFFAFLSST